MPGEDEKALPRWVEALFALMQRSSAGRSSMGRAYPTVASIAGSRSTKFKRRMMFKRIDHVEIVTDQLDRTVQFYTEVLGFTVKAGTGSRAQVWVCPSTWSIWIWAAPWSS